MALRNAGLVQSLSGAGLETTDRGDLPEQVWRPDRDHPRAQNVGQAVEGLRKLTEALRAPLVENDVVLVLGGNCTTALAVMAALTELSSECPGLAYFDRHLDLNFLKAPQSVRSTGWGWRTPSTCLVLSTRSAEPSEFDLYWCRTRSPGSASMGGSPPTGNGIRPARLDCSCGPVPSLRPILRVSQLQRWPPCLAGHWRSTSTSTCSISRMLRSRKTPTGAIPARASINSR